MFKRSLILVTLIFFSGTAFSNTADITVEIEDLTEPSYRVPISAITITAAEISAGGYNSIVEVLERNSNFRASTDSTGAKRSTAVDLRGFGETAGRNVMVILDGVVLNNPTLEAPNLALIPIAQVSEIELIPSGGGVLFGNGAVGGVIRVTTKKNQQGYRPSYELSAGSFGYGHMAAQNQLVTGDATISGEIFRQSSDGYRNFNDSDLGLGKIEYRLDRNFDFAISHSRSLDQRKAAGASIKSILAADRKASNINDRSSIDYRQGVTDLSIGFESNNAVYRGHLAHRQSDQVGAYENPSYGLIKQQLDVVSYKLERANNLTEGNMKKLHYLTGIEIISGKYSSLYISPHRKQVSSAIYGQIGNRFLKNNVALGGRMQWVKDTMHNGFRAEDSLTALDIMISRFFGDSEIYARADQSFRFATLDEQSSTGTPLKPQTGNGLEVGVRSPRLSSRAYIIQNSNEILFDGNDSSQTSFGSNINVDQTKRIGGELALSAKPTNRTEVKGRLSYIDTEIQSGNFLGSAVPGVSDLQINLSSRTKWTPHFESEITHRWYSSTYAISDYENDAGRHNAYGTTALVLNYRQPSWSLSLGFDNLFGVEYDAYVYDSYGTLKSSPAHPMSMNLTFRYLPE